MVRNNYLSFFRWRVKVDSTCSSSCGPGVLRRTIECTQYVKSGEILIVHNNFCAHIEPKPSETEECVGPCKTKTWVYGEWSKVSKLKQKLFKLRLM